MTHYASCGCAVASLDDGEFVWTKDEVCDAIEGFKPATRCGWYCPTCAARAKTWPEYLPNQEAADAWLDEAAREWRNKREAHHG